MERDELLKPEIFLRQRNCSVYYHGGHVPLCLDPSSQSSASFPADSDLISLSFTYAPVLEAGILDSLVPTALDAITTSQSVHLALTYDLS